MRFFSFEARPRLRDHWFSFGGSNVVVTESVPAHPGKSGRTLFFLHGRFGQNEAWNPLLQDLSRHFHCLLLEFPGFGRSICLENRGFSLSEDANLVSHVMERLVPDQAVLVGHDFGGAVAQLCAAHSPEQVAGIVLINSASITGDFARLPLGWRGVRLQRRLRKILEQVELPDPDFRSALWNSVWGNQERGSYLNALKALQNSWPGPVERSEWIATLRSRFQPTLLLWGARDPLNPTANALALMRTLPESHYFENEKCGHWPHLEDPVWVLGKMREFLFRIASNHESGESQASFAQKSLLR